MNWRILLVEDDSTLLMLLAEMFRENGFSVITAMDGEGAIRIINEHKDEIDVVFTDLGLPGMGGWQVLKFIKDNYPAVMVFCGSGYQEEQIRKDLIAAGAEDFLQKPYRMEAIVEQVKNVIMKRKKDTCGG